MATLPNLLAGSSIVSIVPVQPTPLAGYPEITVTSDGPQDHAGYQGRTGAHTGVLDAVYARILTFRSSKASAIVMSLDVCIIPGDFSRDVRRRISARYGVPDTAIIIAATHNHSGPDFSGHWENTDGQESERLAQLLTDSVGEALSNEEPVRVGYGSDMLENISLNRRREDGPIDPELFLLRLDRMDGSCKGLIYSFACHPVIIGTHNTRLSGEFPGFASSVLECAFDEEETIALFLNGGAGDINPRSFPYCCRTNVVLRGRKPDAQFGELGTRSLDAARRFGRVLGGKALSIAASTETRIDGRLGIDYRSITATMKSVPEREELLAHMTHSTKISNFIRSAEHWETSVTLLQIGPVRFVCLPGEPFAETALSMQNVRVTDRPKDRVRVVGYVNDYPGYLVPEMEQGKNRYENIASPLDQAGILKILDEAEKLRQVDLND